MKKLLTQRNCKKQQELSVGMKVEGRGRLAGFLLLRPSDASETCSVTVAPFSGERALALSFVLRFAVDLVDPFFCNVEHLVNNFLVREG